jgi:hypothetical protein
VDAREDISVKSIGTRSRTNKKAILFTISPALEGVDAGEYIRTTLGGGLLGDRQALQTIFEFWWARGASNADFLVANSWENKLRQGATIT